MLPATLLIIPLFVFARNVGLVGIYPGLILAYLTFTLPYSSWLLTGYFATVPTELEQAAMTDGCSLVGAIMKVVLPLMAPAIAAIAIFCFVLA